MALEGTLRDFSFADILQLISLQRKTGVLTLKGEENVVTISFLDGKIVGADALNQHLEDRLGLILLRTGKIGEKELEAALKEQEESLKRLGRILIERGLLRPEEVRWALEQQILQIVFRVFRWKDGEYHFSQETDIDYDRDLVVPMSADSIIMEGARMTDEWPFIEQRIPDREVVFIKTDPKKPVEVEEADADELDGFAFDFEEAPAGGGAKERTPKSGTGAVKLNRRQHDVYELVNGRDSVSELILKSPFVEFETCKALADLLDKGLIRRASQAEVARLLSLEKEVAPGGSGFSLRSLPWLAVPFLVLLGLALSVMPRNPLNPILHAGKQTVERYVLESASRWRIRSLMRSIEAYRELTGSFPSSLEEMVRAGSVPESSTRDPWGRPYRLVVRGETLLIAGSDASGQPVPLLMMARRLPREPALPAGSASGPGVVLLD